MSVIQPRPASSEGEEIVAVVSKAGLQFLKNRPVFSLMYFLGVIAALFGSGFSVEEGVAHRFLNSVTQIESEENSYSLNISRQLRHVDALYYNAKGWFSCDERCMDLYEQKVSLEKELAQAAQQKSSRLAEAKSEVGVWSSFGVSEIRENFWRSWQSGKDTASRMTMMDAFFMAFNRREESLAVVLIRLVLQYALNLTMGLAIAVFIFISTSVSIIQSYGPSFMSGLAFFILVVCASVATLLSFLGMVYGGILGGGYMMIKAQRERLEAGEGGRGRRRQVQYQYQY